MMPILDNARHTQRFYVYLIDEQIADPLCDFELRPGLKSIKA